MYERKETSLTYMLSINQSSQNGKFHKECFLYKKEKKKNLPPTPKADTPEEKHKNEEPD
jgi:hypothetical protein